MRLSVTSEIGRLQSVLIHLPGREIDDMLPSMMEELLFDDILFGQLAREEHRRFQQIIWFVADEIFDLEDLLEETLRDDELRSRIIDDFIGRHQHSKTLGFLRELSSIDLAERLIAGVVNEDLPSEPRYVLPPVPNLFFTRDPQMILGDGVAIASMATRARERESLLSYYVFRHHPAFRDRDVLWTPGPLARDDTAGSATIEGGDVLVAREDILLIGLSERTNRAGVEALAESLKNSDSRVKTIFVVEIPSQRSYMHLDTVFTIIDRHECLMFPPVIAENGDSRAKVYRLDLTRRQLNYQEERSLLGALRGEGMDLEPVPCGGQRRIDQDREQWTDGANAFALSPGVILLYERNPRTAEELTRRGYEVIEEDALLLGRVEMDLEAGNRYAILIQGHELSRARGGPRCMTMPLAREEL
jgi:arginine deiminase